MKLRSFLCGSMAVGLLAAATPASADVITGSFAISGSVTYDTLGTSGEAGLDFELTLPPPTSPSGPFTEVTVATGYFDTVLGMAPLTVGPSPTFLVNGTVGEILNITNVNPPTDADYTYAPAGVDILVNGFLDNFVNLTNSVGSAVDLQFNLTSIPLQSGTSCPATPSCVEGPFVLVETNEGFRIEFDVFGWFVSNGGADTGFYKGSFGITVNGLSFDEAGNRLTVSGLDIACGEDNLELPCSWTANFNPVVTPVPEPATLATFGFGALGIGLLVRRRRKKE
jgi:hypothetical protein